MAWACRRCQRVFSSLPTGERCPHDEGALVTVAEHSLSDEHTGRICDEKYQIGTLLGAGGMGCVHEATNLRLDQKVAVKFFSPRFVCATGKDAAEAAERFRREATLMARVRHANIVHVLDFSIETDGTMYIVMELLEGEPLESRMAKGGLTLGGGLALLAVVLKALEYVHSQDVIHRDLKPSNIFCATVAGREVIKVLDFGIARCAESKSITHGPLGTFRYSAPEQLSGDEVGSEADVYSAGIILSELLTGRPGGQRSRGAKKKVEPPGRSIEITPPLRGLIARSTAQDPDQRFVDAREMGLAMTQLVGELTEEELDQPLPRFTDGDEEERPRTPAATEQAQSPIRASAPTPVEPRPSEGAPLSERKRRRWPLVVGLALGVVLTGLMVAFGLGLLDPISQDRPPRDATAQAVQPAAQDAETIDSADAADASRSKKTVRVTFVSTPKKAKILRLSGDGAEEELCITHCTSLIAFSDQPVTVVFRAPEHADHLEEFLPDQDRIVEAVLTDRSGHKRPAPPQHKTTPAPRAPEGEGFLSVRAIPQSDVYLDGKRLGRSPLTKRVVPAGRHRLRLVPHAGALAPGVTRPERTITVLITPGQTKSVVEYW